MSEVTDIDNVIDTAIIKSLEYMRDKSGAKGLLAGAIKNIVKEKFKIKDNDDVIQSRIREMYRRNILVEVKPSKLRKDKKKVYALNKNIEFNYMCGPLPTEVGSGEIPIEMRRHHTEKLQETIKNWIAFFPEPKAGYPFDPKSGYQEDVKKCENYILFPDLENHLPKMGYGVCSKWRKYKEDLMKLQKRKEGLLSFIKNEISNCFIGFKLNFIHDLEYGINNFECNLLHRILYNLILDLSNEAFVQEAYDNYERCIADFQENTMIVDKESTIWKQKGSDELIKVPKEKREALIAGIDKFKNLLNNIEKAHQIKIGEEIIEEVEHLKKDRDAMTKELADTLQFYSFQGDCKYLSGF